MQSPFAGARRFIPTLLIALTLSLLLSGCLQSSLKKVTLQLGASNNTLRAEVADTPALREKGLMGRAQLPDDEGMLFVYSDDPIPRSFWMANTPLPLEILFIDSFGTIFEIQEMTPCTDPHAMACTIYTSHQPAEYALEVNANYSARHGVKLWDHLPAPIPSSK